MEALDNIGWNRPSQMISGTWSPVEKTKTKESAVSGNHVFESIVLINRIILTSPEGFLISFSCGSARYGCQVTETP